MFQIFPLRESMSLVMHKSVCWVVFEFVKPIYLVIAFSHFIRSC